MRYERASSWITRDFEWANALKSGLRKICWNWVCELIRNRKRDAILNASPGDYDNAKSEILANLAKEHPRHPDLIEEKKDGIYRYRYM